MERCKGRYKRAGHHRPGALPPSSLYAKLQGTQTRSGGRPVVWRLLPVAAYLLAIALAWISPRASIVIYALIPIPYVMGWLYRSLEG